jgi:polysaccharide biosynthesis transport protein
VNTPNNNTLGGTERQATAREFFVVVFRRKWLIAGLFLVTTATVLAISLSTPLVYQSAGRVLIKRGEKESVLYASRQIFNQWEEELASEMEIVKSKPVIDRARELLAAAGSPPPLVQARVDCEVMGKSNAVAIAYVDRDPKVAQRVAQAVIDAYIEYRQNDMTLSYPKQFFDSEIGSTDAELRRLGEERRAFTTREGVVDVDEQKRSDLSLLSNLSSARSETAAELAQVQAEQRTMRELEGRAGMDNPTLGAGPNGQDPIMEIKRQIVFQQARIADLHERYREDAVEVANAESTLATFQAMLKREVSARLDVSQTRVTALSDRLASIDRDIAAVRVRLDRMPATEVRIAELDRQIGALKLKYDNLVEKSGEARITEFTTEPLKVLLLAPAAPATPKTARDYVRLSLAPAFSIVVGIGLAFFVDGLDLTVRTAGHAEEIGELPVLATLNERRKRRRA